MKEKLNAPNWNLLKLQRYQQINFEDKVRLGLPTWESAKFRGTLYDHDTPIDEFLPLYAAQYDAVEYHDAFHDLPSERRMAELKDKVKGINKDFKFCPVIPRRISHEFELGENKYDLQDFHESINQLGDHLGPCILRLPETFSPLLLKTLFKFIKLWPSEKELSVQFTHAEWGKKPELMKPLIKEIENTNVSILIEDRIDVPLDPGKLITSNHLMVRFHGRLNESQDDQRLALWIYRLGEYKALGVKHSYFFLYEQEEVCLSILRKMANSMGGNCRVPQGFEANSKQMGFSF